MKTWFEKAQEELKARNSKPVNSEKAEMVTPNAQPKKQSKSNQNKKVK